MNLSQKEKELLEAYFAGDVSQEAHQAMEAWLKADPQHPRILAEYGLIDRLIAHEQKQSDAKAIFAALLDAEEAAEPIAFPLTETFEVKDDHTERDAISFNHACSVICYAAMQSIKAHAGIIAGAAAVLIIGLVSIQFLLSGPNETTNDMTLFDDTTVIDQTPATPPVVATLTATHNATLTQGALAPGSQLRPNDRLTLTAGFAEITTNQGAVAILQAPAVIELTNNDNAIRLHAGKLVGICETPSSKGFLVRTPHMDITDLGTRFGVDASDTAATQVHVLEGEVQVASNSGIFSTERLRAGESARGSSIVSQLVRITFDPSLFDAPALGAVAHLGTGQNLAPGTADPDWQIVAIDGMALDQPVIVEVADPSKFTNTIRENLRFMPNVPSRSQWITLPDSIDFESIQETVTYQTRFDTTGLDLSMLQAKLRFVADNQIKSIGLNGQMLRVPPHATDTDYTHMTAIPIEQGLVQGENTLTLTVRRYRVGTTNHYWTGLRTELELIDRRLRVGPNE